MLRQWLVEINGPRERYRVDPIAGGTVPDTNAVWRSFSQWVLRSTTSAFVRLPNRDRGRRRALGRDGRLER
jgi:hypothetical protein